MAKTFNRMFNVGRSRYVVNFHDGEKKHKDGSRFFDIEIFSNKRKFLAFIRSLLKQGYVES